MGKKILITDDQSQVRRLVLFTLGPSYEFIEADSGAKAVEMATNETPDLIIMDVMMPGEYDGIEAVRRIRKLEHCKKTYILMLSAMGQDIDKEKGFSVGVNEYFVKPFSPTALINKVEEILG